MEYVDNTPWAMKTFDGREKSLLAAGVRRGAGEVAYPSTQEPKYAVAKAS